MNAKENRKLWIEALRSGKYKQGKFFLSRTDAGIRSYCCLGVACELAVERGLIIEREVPRILFPEKGSVFSYEENQQSLPPAVQEWLGLRTSSGDWGESTDYFSLTNRNDKGASFADIAETIEAEPKGLVVES